MVMVAGALSAALSVALGVGISVTLTASNPAPLVSRQGTIATIVALHAGLDAADVEPSSLGCVGCR
jgi:hypothetical protein